MGMIGTIGSWMNSDLSFAEKAAATVSSDVAIGYGAGMIGDAINVNPNVVTPWMPMTSDIGVGMQQGQDIGSAALNGATQDVQIVGGALSGAAAGSAIPVVGTIVGAVAGAATTAAGMSVDAIGQDIGNNTLSWIGKGISMTPAAAAAGVNAYNLAISSGTEAIAAGTAASAADAFGEMALQDAGYVAPQTASPGIVQTSGEVNPIGEMALQDAGDAAGKSALSFSNLMTYGGWGVKGASLGWGLYSGLKAADAIEDEANYKADMEEKQADLDEENAKLTELSAENYDLRNAALEKAGDYEKEALLKRRRQIAGQARAAAAANGVMLEGRAESSPAMFEQDAAAEAQYEIGKIASDVRTKQAFNDINKAMTMAKAANQRYGAGIRRYGASVTRSLGNMKASNQRLNSWVDAGLGAAQLGFGIAGSNTMKSLFED